MENKVVRIQIIEAEMFCQFFDGLRCCTDTKTEHIHSFHARHHAVVLLAFNLFEFECLVINRET